MIARGILRFRSVKRSSTRSNRFLEIFFSLHRDTNCDGEVDLSEYLTYILFEHQEREIMYNMSKPIPYPSAAKEFTMKSLSSDFYIGVKNQGENPVFELNEF